MAQEAPSASPVVPQGHRSEPPIQADFHYSPSVSEMSDEINSSRPRSLEPADNEQAAYHKDKSTKRWNSRLLNKSFSWWWWWEIGGSLLSIISISLVIPILKQIDGKSIESWQYAIQPSSLISVLTTITKTAMMVPIASCLSQLKWDHFQYRPNPLNHLQLYDEASRGPWGSFLLIVTGRLRVVTAWVLAIITLFALAIEPSAQQILEPLSRQAILPNVTAQIGIAQNYSSKAIWSGSLNAYGGPRNPNGELLRLQTSIANGTVGSIPEVNLHCPQPASQCTWDQFTTLAICSTFDNFTNTMKPTYNNQTFRDTYTYSFPRGDDVIMSFSTGGSGGRTLFNTTGSTYQSNGVYGAVVNGARTADPGDDIQTFTMTWTWCLKTYHRVVASPAGIEEVDYTSEPLLRDDTIPHGIQPWDTYFANSSGENFNITVSLGTGLWQYLDKLFTRELQSPLTGESVDTDFSMGEFMYFADLAAFTKDVEDTLSNQVRSSSPGDNEWSESRPGQAFYRETYWHVRWGWIALPVGEVLMTALLLVISIMWTRDQPLFMSSALALLYHGFDRHDEGESLLEREKSMDELADMVKGVEVEFKEAENGVLKFVRVGGKGY